MKGLRKNYTTFPTSVTKHITRNHKVLFKVVSTCVKVKRYPVRLDLAGAFPTLACKLHRMDHSRAHDQPNRMASTQFFALLFVVVKLPLPNRCTP